MHRAKKVSKSGKTKDQGDATLKSIHFIKILTRLTDKKTHNIFRLTNQDLIFRLTDKYKYLIFLLTDKKDLIIRLID